MLRYTLSRAAGSRRGLCNLSVFDYITYCNKHESVNQPDAPGRLARSGEAAREIEEGGDAVFAAAVAKKFAGRVAVPAITACIQAMGANGLRQDSALGRHLAGAKIAAFTDGSTEMMNERIGVSMRRDRF